MEKFDIAKNVNGCSKKNLKQIFKKQFYFYGVWSRDIIKKFERDVNDSLEMFSLIWNSIDIDEIFVWTNFIN